jgi:hypothetical protein
MGEGVLRPAARKQSVVPVAAPFAPPSAVGRRHQAGLVWFALAGFLLLASSAVVVYCVLINAQPDDNGKATADTNSQPDDKGKATADTSKGKSDKTNPLPPDPKPNDKQPPSGPGPTQPKMGSPPDPKTSEGPRPSEPEPKEPESPSPPSPPKNPNPTPDPDLPPLPVKSTQPKPKDGDSYLLHLTKENQTKVNMAIDKGVAYLLKKPAANGCFGEGTNYEVGYTALAGLTLLECGKTAADPAVEKAAAYVRKEALGLAAHNRPSYQISLAILFLDRLGNKDDQKLIQFLALRLIAGQQTDGGWPYECPELTLAEAQELFVYLHATRPVPFVLNQQGNFVPLILPNKEPPAPPPPLPKKDTNPMVPVGGDPGDKKKPIILLPFPEVGNTGGKLGKPLEPTTPEINPQLSLPAEPLFKPFNIDLLCDTIKNVTVVKMTPTPKLLGRKKELPMGNTDNSVTQFVVLALWVARKHNIPVEKVMALVDQRFLTSQNADGGWDYWYKLANNDAHYPSMTCAGLIGLAVGHGTHKESLGVAWKLTGGKGFPKDPAIDKGLAALGKWIGTAPKDWNQKVKLTNLYFVWSVERMAMLCNLKTIGGKDWYHWAAHMLVVNQQEDGQWEDGTYIGSDRTLDTCFALLVLKRANFVPDLTESLKDYVLIVDPAAK